MELASLGEGEGEGKGMGEGKKGEVQVQSMEFHRKVLEKRLEEGGYVVPFLCPFPFSFLCFWLLFSFGLDGGEVNWR